MIRYRVLPYRQGSRSAKALAEALGGKRLRLEGSTFKGKPDDIVINWGCSGMEAVPSGSYRLYNPPICTQLASNKLWFFEHMKDTGLTPECWTNKEEIPNETYPIVCRTILSGHSGAGIHVATSFSDLVDAPLYVKYEKKKEEYRVHVGKTSTFVGGDDHGDNTGWDEQIVTIAVQRKARRLSTPDEEVNWQVRNLAGGFVYTREGFTVPSAVEEAAHDCLRQTGLDFGAVDVIWNEQKEKAWVLEVNTAPGLEGQTVQDYTNYFRGNI